MPSLASIPPFTTGQVPAAAQMQTIPAAVDTISRLASGWPVGSGPQRKPATKVALLSTESIPNAADTVIQWDVDLVDDDNLHAMLYNSTLQVNTPGWWWVELQVAYPYVDAQAATIATERNVCLCVNGTDNAHVTASSNTVQSYNNNQRIQVTSYEHLAYGAQVFARTYQNSGSPLNLLPESSTAATNAAWGTWLTMRWDAPY